MRPLHMAAACAFVVLLAGCGGGGSGGSPESAHALPPISQLPAPGATSHPTSNPTSAATSTPPASSTSPTASPTPLIIRSFSHFPSTVGRIGLAQIFDYAGGYMSASTIGSYGKRVDAVWASLEPGLWQAAHPGMLVSDYFIMGFDQYGALHHSLSWWQSSHPSWILYACKANGTPTHDIAYMPGIGVPDMPLDIHNKAVVDYQIAAMSQSARSAGYNALAIDQVVFWNTLQGGNPSFGQKLDKTEFGCGIWQNGSFVRHYATPSDRAWNDDVTNYVKEAHAVAHQYGMNLIISHPPGSISNADEQTIVANSDELLDETGFSDYGHYSQSGGLFESTLAYMRYVQSMGTGFILIDKFANEAHVDTAGFEYSLATYMLGNEGAALLFVGGLHEYGTDTYHSQYDQEYGTPCGRYTNSGAVYARRFTHAVAVVNTSGSAQTYALPSGRSYRDVMSGSSSSTLHLAPYDGYVLTTSTAGC